ncbi:MAG: hypothetical protein Q7T61_10070 [Caulobacter sp.]|nr:hypothetical protein [Caulobacter sp.]
MAVRKATAADVEACAALLSAHREQLMAWNPRFWNPSAIAGPMTRAFLGHQVQQAETFLVFERDGVEGFLIATPAANPPVFDPGGPSVLIDDFCVREGALWPEVGGALLGAAREGWREKGVAQVIAVCADADAAKKSFLQSQGLATTSVWLAAPV